MTPRVKNPALDTFVYKLAKQRSLRVNTCILPPYMLCARKLAIRLSSLCIQDLLTDCAFPYGNMSILIIM